MERGRRRQFNPERAGRLAMERFWAQGYGATSLRDLTRAMGVSKSTLYQSFGDKERLFMGCLNRYRDQLIDRLETRLAAAPSARDFLQSLFQEAAETAESDQARLGCLIFNSATELGHDDGAAAQHARACVERLSAFFARSVVRAQHEGAIDPTRDPDDVAAYLTVGMAGLRALVKSGARRDRARAAARQLLTNLD